MDIDMSELRTFTAAIEATAKNAPRKARASVVKGANNIKRQLRREASGSRSFGQVANTITYDIRGGGDLGGSFFEAEVGPNTHFRAARIENIGYFGSSRAGGGTLPDPAGALGIELPKLEKYLGDLGEEIT